MPSIVIEPLGESFEESDTEQIAKLCERRDIKAMSILLIKHVINAVNTGVRFIVDVEPNLYESVLTTLRILATCASTLGESSRIIRGANGENKIISFHMYAVSAKSVAGVETLDVVIKQFDETRYADDLSEAVVDLDRIIMYVERGKPSVDISTAVYYQNLIPRIVKTVYDKLYAETKDPEWRVKRDLIQKLPLDIIILRPADLLKASLGWTPPPPPFSSYFSKPVGGFDDLILPSGIMDVVRKFARIAKLDGRGNMLLIGLSASGRKTIATAIGKELGLPIYRTSANNFFSSLVGKSEERLRAMFSGIRARGGVLIFENVETLFKKRTGENVTANLRNILIDELTREDNNFIIIFTTTESVQSTILDTPLIGEVKVVVPPPTSSLRRRLAERFLRMIANNDWNTLVKIAMEQRGFTREKAETHLVRKYAYPLADAGVGLTSGELYRIMRWVLLPVIEDIIRTRKLIDIDKEVASIAKRDYPTRQAKLAKLRELSVRLGFIDIAYDIKKVEEEVRKRAVEVKKILEKLSTG